MAARLLPKQEIAGSNPVIRSIRKTRTMDPIQQWDSQPSFHGALPEKTWTNSLGMGTQRQGIKETCHRPSSSAVRIPDF